MSPPKTVRVEAQAKLNLALRVLRRDETGYHPLETLFIRLDLADTLYLTTGSGKKTLSSDPPVGPAEKNLAVIAAQTYAAATGWPGDWEIRISKKIPVGAGLGGGSADAGAVLRGLNALAPAPLAPRDLLALATSIGADVAFMAGNSEFAFAEGYGETLTPLHTPPRRIVGLAIPGFGVATPDAYAWLDSDRAVRADRPRWDLSGLSWEAIDGMIENDFTAVVGRRHPVIPRLVEWFRSRGAASAGMTGSGSVVFGMFDKLPDERGDSLPGDAKLLWTSTADRVVQPVVMG